MIFALVKKERTEVKNLTDISDLLSLSTNTDRRPVMLEKNNNDDGMK